MSIDLYTRGVLTVIALCLVWLCVNSMTPSAAAQTAQTAPQRVIVAGTERPLAVTITDTAGASLIGSAGLRVSLGETVVPIAIRAIERQQAGSWQPIQVEVLRPAPTVFPAP